MSNFEWPVRVYYEDTDAGGVVFYANYLAFFERARTEWLRSIQLDATQLRSAHSVLFVVRHVEVDYLAPAMLDDALRIVTRIAEVGGSKVVFEQSAWRGEQCLVHGKVVTVCVSTETFTATRLPEAVRTTITRDIA